MQNVKRALIAMSGGVDSGVAAYIIKKSGFECAGAMMNLLCENKNFEQDSKDAAEICQKLQIPFFSFDFSKEFKKEVIDKFICTYQAGLTPNPCIDCNRKLKFGLFMDKAIKMGYDFVVTGHYARIENTSGQFVLKKAFDEEKDQSYMLYTLNQSALSHIMFPLGNMTKSEVRNIAKTQGFVNAKKSDSQDICFVPDGNYANIIEYYSGKVFDKGNFVSRDGKILGKHNGIIRYTVGQRKGLGIAFGQPMYVFGKNAEKNEVILCKNEELFSSELESNNFNWISGIAPSHPIKAKAKIRYRQTEQSADVIPISANKARIVFDTPQRAIAKGQAVVLYDGDSVIGGGTII